MSTLASPSPGTGLSTVSTPEPGCRPDHPFSWDASLGAGCWTDLVCPPPAQGAPACLQVSPGPHPDLPDRSIKRYFLMDQGDFFVHFMDLTEEELKKPVDDIAPSRLEALLELALRMSTANTDPYKDDLKVDSGVALAATGADPGE